MKKICKKKLKRYWLIQLRINSGKTLKEIADSINVTPQCLFYWEQGIRNPKPSKAKELAAKLNFDWTEFYERKE